jgi:long-chain acyl-CoA synthetase
MLRRVKRLVPAYSLPGHVLLSKALAEGARLRFTPVALQPDDVALLQYTGGTTGLCKGAVLLHRNLIAKVLASEAWNQPGLQKKPVAGPLNIVCALPLHHVFAFVSCALLGLRMGACNLLIANPRDLKLSIKALQPYKLHIFPAVNTLFKGLLQHPDFGLLNFSELLICVGGGSPLQAAMAEDWQARTGCAIVQGYGLSETSSGVTSDRTDTDHFTGTVGLPIPGVRIRILSDDGHDLPPGEPGEVVIHGPQLMRGYWNQEAETRAAFTPDGGFRSGDIGVMDAQGQLKIVDRKKDMIIVSGFKVYPAEVEAVVGSHPEVQECAVVGVPDEKSGEAVWLFVVRRDSELSEEVLDQFCAEQLSAYKRPRQVCFVEALPKTSMGKLLRRELRVAAAAGNVSNGT